VPKRLAVPHPAYRYATTATVDQLFGSKAIIFEKAGDHHA
jgi:hypothetical protein